MQSHQDIDTPLARRVDTGVYDGLIPHGDLIAAVLH